MLTHEQLYAELYQCKLLLQGMAARLAQLEAMIPGNAYPGNQSGAISPRNAEAGKQSGAISPSNIVAGNPLYDISPNTIEAGNLQTYPFPGKTEAGKHNETLSRLTSEAGNPSVEPSPERLAAVLKAQAFPFRTSRYRIARGATLLLAIRRDPTKHGVAHYAKLLRMSASGAGKFMMDVRRLGLIRHKAYSVHELTPRGEELVQAALRPAAEAL